MNEEELILKIEQEKSNRKRKNQRTKVEWFLEKDLKNLKEAKSVGLVYLGSILCSKGNRDYANYELPCGHTDSFQITHVRRNNFSCKKCFEENIKNLCLKYNLTVEGKNEKHPANRIFKRINCGHNFSISPSNLTEVGLPECTNCYEESLSDLCKPHGLIYIGKYDNCGTKRRYKYQKCGHYKDSHPRLANSGRAVCRECQEIRYSKEAELFDLQFVGFAKSGEAIKRRYKLPCGCEKDLRLDHVRSGSWSCDVCDDTYFTKPSQVYLIKVTDNNFSWLKLGFTKNLQTRTQNYSLSKNCNIQEIKLLDFDTGREAITFEKRLHSLLKSFRLNKHIMSNYMNNGHTECYPIDCENLILSYLENKNE